MPEGEKVCRPDWLILFRSFRMANDWVKISLGFLGAAVTLFVLLLAMVGFLMLQQQAGGVVSRDAVAAFNHGEFAKAAQRLGKGVAGTVQDARIEAGRVGASILTADIAGALGRAKTLKKVVPWMLIGMLITWMIWSYFGGGISRAAAFELATGERLSSTETRVFAGAHYNGYLWGPLGLLLVIVGLLLCLWLVGLAAAHLGSAVFAGAGFLVSLYVGVVVKQKKKSHAAGAVAGAICFAASIAVAVLLWGMGPAWLERLALVVIGFPVGIAIGLAIALAAIVLMFGRGIMHAAISFEGTEGFDAITRAADYVLKRPCRLLFYWLVGGVYGVLCFGVVCLLAASAFLIAAGGLFAGFGISFREIGDLLFDKNVSFLQFLPAFLLAMIGLVVAGLVVAWGIAFVVSLRTICYALVRKSVDLCEISEVYQEAGRIPSSTV